MSERHQDLVKACHVGRRKAKSCLVEILGFKKYTQSLFPKVLNT